MKLPDRRHILHLAAGAAALPTLSRIATAQAYPARPVRVIVGFAPVVPPTSWHPWRVNGCRSGSASNSSSTTDRALVATPAEAIVRALADGYTLLLVGVPNAINATLYDRLNFNLIRDIAPVLGAPTMSPASCSRQPHARTLSRHRPCND
jgi:hypothetical protein